MLRAVTALLLTCSAAMATPQYSEIIEDGTKLVCVTGLEEAEYNNLWRRLLQELEFAGYKKVSEGARGHADFSNGFYKVFVSQNDTGPCVQYMDQFQPEIPAMWRGNLGG